MPAGTYATDLVTFAPGLNLRVIDKDGEPWFVAADVCRALDMDTTKGATRWTAALDLDEVSYLRISGVCGRPMAIVSESGLYSLVMRSNKPAAKTFRKWVTSEVLPAIRKTGSYTVDSPIVVRQPQAPAQDTMQALAAAVTTLNETVRMLLAEAHLRSRYAARAMPPSSTRTVAP